MDSGHRAYGADSSTSCRRVCRPPNQNPVRGKRRLDHVVNLACGISAAADFHANIAGADEGSGMALFGLRVAEGQVARGFSRYRESRLDRQVESVGQPAEDIAATADCREIAGTGGDGARSSEQHDRELPVGRIFLVGRARM